MPRRSQAETFASPDIGRKSKPHPFSKKGKGQSDFSDWPLLMPATTYAPTHLARAVPSALRGYGCYDPGARRAHSSRLMLPRLGFPGA